MLVRGIFRLARKKAPHALSVTPLCVTILCAVFVIYGTLNLGPTPALAAPAEPKAVIIADQMVLEGKSTLIARGNVQVSYRGATLTATQIIYDRVKDRLKIQGPIRLTHPNGSTLEAAQADLSADLTEGIVTEVRVLLDKQLRISAQRGVRKDGNIAQFDVVRASSCVVCKEHPIPLWEIRADEVTDDREKRRLYFKNASLYMMGFPTLYAPILSIPEPGVKRASGLLYPRLHTSTTFGPGMRLPYFWAIGPSKDLTFSPYINTAVGAVSLELRYRQAFRRGKLTINGAYSRDTLSAGKNRYYLALNGRFDLPYAYKLDLVGTYVSDSLYLDDYDLAVRDRLFNKAEITKAQHNDYTQGRVIGIQNLRTADQSATQALSTGRHYKRFPNTPVFGGESVLLLELEQRLRKEWASSSQNTLENTNVARVTLQGDWQRNWFLNNGMVFSALTRGRADYYIFSPRDAERSYLGRASLIGALQLRWPFEKTDAQGISHIIQPVLQLVPQRLGNRAIIDEDSQSAEFDESSLLMLNRVPGADVLDAGNHLSLGLTYSRIAPDGSFFSTMLGKVIRRKPDLQFSESSGLQGAISDWLTSVQWNTPQIYGQNVQLSSRLLIKNSGGIRKSDTQLALAGKRYDLSTTHVWILPDKAENRESGTSRVIAAGSYRITDSWTTTASVNYDINRRQAEKGSLGLRFENECLSADFKMSRTFVSTRTVRRNLKFELNIDFLGLGNKSTKLNTKTCQ